MKQEGYTVDELFPSWKEPIIGSNTNQREYSSFIDVRDLEWARGHGFRFERKKKTKESAKS